MKKFNAAIVLLFAALFVLTSVTFADESDSDGDGILDSIDNCPAVYNPDQADTETLVMGACLGPGMCSEIPDADACTLAGLIGEGCEWCPDCGGEILNYGDGVGDACDNCPSAINPTQADSDNDGIGDACETYPIARAGSDQFVSFGGIVHLDGSASSDLDTPVDQLLFEWTQVLATGDTLVSLYASNTAIAHFTATSNVESLTFQLSVTDTTGNTVTDNLNVTVLEDASQAIFVSSSLGDDSNSGTRESPVKTMSKALQLAGSDDLNSTSRSDIYIHEGDYLNNSTLIIRDGVSLYGGFKAVSSSGSVQGWTRTASNPTQLYGSTKVMQIEGISSPTTIDGLKIGANAASNGLTLDNVQGNGTYLHFHTQNDINEVWLVDPEGTSYEDEVIELISPNLVSWTTEMPHKDYELRLNIDQLHDPSEEPLNSWTDWYYMIRYRIQKIRHGEYIYNYTYRFAPWVHYLEGYEILRETIFVYGLYGEAWPYVRFDQVLRGPDNALYLYRPWAPVYIPWQGFFYDPDCAEDWPGPRSISTDDSAYDWNELGEPGGDSIAIEVLDSNTYLRISNNTVVGNQGGDGGSGSAGGYGGNGGDSIAILLNHSTPVFTGNDILTSGGGNGGDGSPGGHGGDSCGIKTEYTSWPSYSNNDFQIGLAGVGGSTDGQDGMHGDICPPPGSSETNLINQNDTVVHLVTVPNRAAQIAFSSGWGGSDVEMTLVTPSSVVIGRDTVDPDVTHTLGTTYEMYTILNPEEGEWIVQLYGLDVPVSGELVTFAAMMVGDMDNDGVEDGSDNCPTIANSDQADEDGDEVGDACDNCPKLSNPGQTDCNRDGIGNLCDAINPFAEEACDGLDNDCDGVVDNQGDAWCNDGAWCNGVETCGGLDGCQSGEAPICDDGIGCTIDSCNEDMDSCDHAPDDTYCDNGLACDGTEYCDVAFACQPGTPVDCSAFDIEGIAICEYNPDNNPFTWDYRPVFLSQCIEPSCACTLGDENISHSCSVSLCGAECDVSSVWEDYCAGDERRFVGTCGLSSCTWSYSSEDCNAYDGWYDVTPTVFQEIPIPGEPCNQMKQKQQESRDYTCGTMVECRYGITGYRWLDVEVIDYDADDDMVCNDVDKCSYDVPGGNPWYAQLDLKPNHFDSSNWIIANAYGCSCAQVLYCKPGTDTGEYKFGCSKGIKETWEAQSVNSWAVTCQVNDVVFVEDEPE